MLTWDILYAMKEETIVYIKDGHVLHQLLDLFWMVKGLEVVGCLSLEVNLSCMPGDWIIGMRFTFCSSFWKAAWFLISFKAILERRNSVFSSVIWHRSSITWLIHCSNNCWSFPCKLRLNFLGLWYSDTFWKLKAVIPSY